MSPGVGRRSCRNSSLRSCRLSYAKTRRSNHHARGRDRDKRQREREMETEKEIETYTNTCRDRHIEIENLAHRNFLGRSRETLCLGADAPLAEGPPGFKPTWDLKSRLQANPAQASSHMLSVRPATMDERPTKVPRTAGETEMDAVKKWVAEVGFETAK